MLKSDAIQLLGGTPRAAADALGITPSAIYQWPEELPEATVFRIQAYLWRQQRAAQDQAKTEAA